MKKGKFIFAFIGFLACSVFADTIYLKNGNKIENATLTEITQTDIKYNVSGRVVVYTISKDSTAKVVYNDGSEDIFQPLEQPIISDFSGMLEDSRDGKTYKTVKMPDGKIWMAENLNYEIDKSVCYDNKKDYCDYCGRLYNWKMAMEACPAGWHLPSDAEWSNLKTASGGKAAGTALKSKSSWSKSFWNGDNGTDDYGFSVLACGFAPPYLFFPSDPTGYGSKAFFWHAKDDMRVFMSSSVGVGTTTSDFTWASSALGSVRCVKDDTLKTPKPFVEPSGYIGYQRIWDMHNIRLSIYSPIYDWGIYFTEGLDVSDRSFAFEFIAGGVHRLAIIQPDNFIRTSFGLFGGLGMRVAGYSTSDYGYSSKDKKYINMRHELGAELILGYISLYIAERNFYRIGAGIGLAFWRLQ